MDIREFIEKNNVDYSPNLISESDIEIFEIITGVTFGKQMKKYITEYGYLGFGYIEFFGINSKQGTASDMIKQTQHLHKYFPKTNHFLAFEDQGDGDYYLVDKNDDMYRYVSTKNNIYSLNTKLFDYIMKRFLFVKSSLDADS